MLHGPVRVDPNAKLGKATVTLTLKGWDVPVQVTKYEITIKE